MKVKKLFLLLALFIISFSGYSQKFYTIEKGTIKGDFKITLVEQNAVLNPNKFFSIIDLNLKTNKPFHKDLNAAGYKRGDLISYKMTIERLSDHKIYYGRIAFYNMINKPYIINQAVSGYYNIAIPEGYFGQANNGLTSCVYEYYGRKKGDVLKFPTWAVWFSDVPN